MKNPTQKFRQSSIVLEKLSLLLGNLETLTSTNYRGVEYFLLKFSTCFLLLNVYKRVLGFFLFCLNLELFAKLIKDLFSTLSLKPFLLITQDLNKI